MGYTKRISDLVQKTDDDDCVASGAPQGETLYIWKDSNVEKELEEKIKYVDRDIAVPSTPKVVEILRLETKILEVKVPQIVEKIIIKEKAVEVKEIVEKIKTVDLRNDVEKPVTLTKTEEKIKIVEVIKTVEKLVP